ncbi:MAG: hypothetical protein KGZ25_11800, partial [Planctomycetes bacterium]|nr:hypothetical protein [Planctomycetota bacterium]
GTHKIQNGYEKKIKSVELTDELRIYGEGPFEARIDGEEIVIHTRGRRRVLHVTNPSAIIRPQYYVDGQQWMACWTDYPASGWGSYKNTWLIGLTVPAGEHTLRLRNMRFPEIWDRPFEPFLKDALKN